MHCSERRAFIWQQADNDAPRDLQDTYVCKREFPAYCILLPSCIRSPYFWQKDLCIDLDILCDLWTWYLDDLDLWLKKEIFYSPILLQRHNSVSVSCVTVSFNESGCRFMGNPPRILAKSQIKYHQTSCTISHAFAWLLPMTLSILQLKYAYDSMV